jgi:hypothetical protein
LDAHANSIDVRLEKLKWANLIIRIISRNIF